MNMVFTVALYVPWCRYLSNQHGVTPQLYADSLKCTTTDGHAPLSAAKFTDRYIRAVGQEASPSKCVLLSTSKATWKRMKNWAISAGDKSLGTKLNVRDLGITLISRGELVLALFLVERSKLPLRFIWLVHSPVVFVVFCDSLGLFGLSTCLLGCMVLKVRLFPVKNLDSFRTGIVKACWAQTFPMANPHPLLSLLDALFVIWVGFRLMRRYLAYRPAEVPRVFRLLDLAAAGRPGHGPVHLLFEVG